MKIVITVGRQYGSGGRIFAKRLAEEFKIPLYDKDIIEKASEKSGIAKEHFEKADEKRTNSFLFSLASAHYMTGAPMEIDSILTEDSLFMHTADILKELASNSCVILGRCGDEVLKDVATLRIFVCGETEDRIKRIAARFDLSEKAAATLIKKTDKKRAAYHNNYALKEWGLADTYDLCINTSKIDIEDALVLVKDYINHLESKHSGKA